MAVLQLLGIEQLFRVVVPCPVPPQTHTSPCPTEDSRIKKSSTSQRGAIAILAIVILVLLGIIGGFMASTSQVQHLTTAMSWQGIQTWFAARSGMEWALEQATRTQATHDAFCTSSPVAVNFDINLSGKTYSIDVQCDDNGGFNEEGVLYEVDLLTVVATHGTPGKTGFSSRTISATVTRGAVLP